MDKIAPGDLSRLEKVTNIQKALSEARKATADTRKAISDARLARTQLRTTRTQAWSALLVPLVSVITVLVTTVIQTQQLNESRRQTEAARIAAQEAGEDARWNALVGSIKNPDDFRTDTTLLARLRAFTESPRYRQPAVDIAKRAISEASTATLFRDLFDVAFPKVESPSIHSIAEISRRVGERHTAVQTQCEADSAGFEIPEAARLSYGFLCSNNVTDAKLAEIVRSTAIQEEFKKKRQLVSELYGISSFLGEKVPEYLRNRDKFSDTSSVNFSRAYIRNASFDSINFAGIDLSNVYIASSSLTGAKLVPVWREVPGLLTANWWDAETIDQDLLIELTRRTYPNWLPNLGYKDNYSIDRSAYYSRIAALCTSKRPQCQPKCLRIADDPPPTDPECKAPIVRTGADGQPKQEK
ncbi:hypothetical protein [Microvirga sp. BSC39]|uniref:hypothetical protein n=1 Tax=Microvirga sp. BSC39 TaxID=1549810 RepID=UPI00126A405C|nr:hypothetical protein [Microvirga sp. BSC39]